MKVVAVTGGIASGKSTVVQGLASGLQCPWLSCDRVVDDLYRDAEVIAAVHYRFGKSCFSQGQFDRKALGKIVFGDEKARRWLEELLHPLVLQAVELWIANRRGEARFPWGLVEVPLLYEVDFPLKRDIDVVVGCSLSTQLERIMRRDQMGEEQARSRVQAQLPIELKVIRADVVLWNDGSRAVLERLIGLAADRIKQ